MIKNVAILFWLVWSYQGICAEESANAKAGKGRTNHFITFAKYLGGKRAVYAYNHTINKMYRGGSDCQPNCPLVDIWKYQYKDPITGEIIESETPISTQKKYWKVPFEARLIAVTLFGNKNRYLQGLMDFIQSFSYLKEANQIEQDRWGYETFTIRVYVAKRNPASQYEFKEPLINATSDRFIEKLLDLGCEIVYVDNGLERVGLDATFWRFMAAAEDMPEGQSLRYLMRDVDWMFTAGEAFTVGEWINSGYAFHRMHLLPTCMGPLSASIWAGYHTGNSHFAKMKQHIENFPYRLEYGDDELFLRDMVWPKMKAQGEVMTHHYKRGVEHHLGQPYEDSCEEPTKKFCDMLNPDNSCVDITMPKDLLFPAMEMAADLESFESLSTRKPEYFKVNTYNKRYMYAWSGLSFEPTPTVFFHEFKEE